MADALETVLLAAAGRRNSLRLVRVKVTAVTLPTLTLQLPDGSTIPGLAITGLTYTVGGYGIALLAEGIVPPVLPTA